MFRKNKNRVGTRLHKCNLAPTLLVTYVPAVSQQRLLIYPTLLQAFDFSVRKVYRFPMKNLWHFGHCADISTDARPLANISPFSHQGHFKCNTLEFIYLPPQNKISRDREIQTTF